MQNHKNKLIYILCIVIFSACIRKTEEDASRPNLNLVPKGIKNEINSLVKTSNADTLNMAIAKLDSILLDKKNANIGYYFYQRGYCFFGLLSFKKAVSDLKKAKELNYLTDNCTDLIEFSESMIAVQERYN